ncbi:MAG: alpha/beta fold hydrolase [Candidatus Thorarchaeota archaeon]|nr:alpha/beta fold hydrolase [Candidatus Thorarchaeota archaeon]
MAPLVKGVKTYPEGANIAFLLVHGFCAAPDEMRTLWEFLEDNGIASFAVKVEGHGTTPEDLKNTTWKDWFNSVKIGLEEVRSWGTNYVFIAGLSMGGALSTLLTAESEDIDGLVLIAPALKIEGLLPKLVPILKYVLKDREIDVEASQEKYDIKRTKYSREPVSAYHELFKLQNVARKSMSRVSVPCIIIQGTEDKTIDPRNGKIAYEGIGSKDKELHFIEGAEHVITCHPTRKEAYPLILSFIERIVKKSV